MYTDPKGKELPEGEGNVWEGLEYPARYVIPATYNLGALKLIVIKHLVGKRVRL